MGDAWVDVRMSKTIVGNGVVSVDGDDVGDGVGRVLVKVPVGM